MTGSLGRLQGLSHPNQHQLYSSHGLDYDASSSVVLKCRPGVFHRYLASVIRVSGESYLVGLLDGVL